MATQPRYTMRISRKTVDKLGVKLYDQAAAVVAEMIANSYDANAEKVTAKIPLNVWLATIREGKVQDRGFEMVVEDDGHGMTPDEANEFYLTVGRDRRADPRQGPRSRLPKCRKVMGRKGIGKLAPFGICKEMEVWSAGGENTGQGYEVTNFILKYDEIIKFEAEEAYHPSLGGDDGKFVNKTGTRIILRNFNRRRISDADTFHRQIARRFSIGLPDFAIFVEDTTCQKEFKIGQFEIPLMEQTKIVVDERPIVVTSENDEGKTIEEETLQVSGWVAFSKESYKDEEMAGIRIYTRGKLATVTRDFGIKSGFTGENDVRSYVVGDIKAEWLDPDEGEDLNRTDRQDILWNTSRGRAFQEWGRKILKELGKLGRKPIQEKNWHQFLEKTNLEEQARKQLQSETLVKRAVNLGKMLGSRLDQEELQDEERVKEVADICIAFAPQLQWIDTIESIGETANINLTSIACLFAEAKIGEIALLGRVALQRVTAINRLKIEIDTDKEVNEKVLQKIIEEAIWLINPQWTVFGMNKTFKTVRERFEKWYEKKNNGEKITTSTIGDDETIRPDFVLLNPGKHLHIVEIKKRYHVFGDDEYVRLHKYIESLDTFLSEHEEFQEEFGKHCDITLVCDNMNINKIFQDSFDKLKDEGRLQRIPWNVFLVRAENAQQDFISALQP